MDYQNVVKDMITYLPYQGEQYQSPAKAGPLATEMNQLKHKGQKARLAFTTLAQAFKSRVPGFQLQRTSQWMNQAQIIRPHFWAYLIEASCSVHSPALALRLLNDVPSLGLSLEVSMIERQQTEQTLLQQNQVLRVAPDSQLYYLAQIKGVNHRLSMTESNRQKLLKGVSEGLVRKVQVKFDVPEVRDFPDEAALMTELKRGWDLLQPYYQETKNLL